MTAKKGCENDFWQKVTDHSGYSLRVENFVKITLSCTVSEINEFLHFTQKFKMAATNGGKCFFLAKSGI